MQRLEHCEGLDKPRAEAHGGLGRAMWASRDTLRQRIGMAALLKDNARLLGVARQNERRTEANLAHLVSGFEGDRNSDPLISAKTTVSQEGRQPLRIVVILRVTRDEKVSSKLSLAFASAVTKSRAPVHHDATKHCSQASMNKDSQLTRRLPADIAAWPYGQQGHMTEQASTLVLSAPAPCSFVRFLLCGTAHVRNGLLFPLPYFRSFPTALSYKREESHRTNNNYHGWLPLPLLIALCGNERTGCGRLAVTTWTGRRTCLSSFSPRFRLGKTLSGGSSSP
ncbi:hypothetical protein HAX54_044023 [Datura stramonium]|uniref:Uncharacterized protein n=1 Tax=Datura stramonium TaxID=4076 RepID=A0ABS8W216_DATST|nr:hypothetical protein [Datura stramonium]